MTIPFLGSDGNTYQIDADKVDMFRDGRTGRALTDGEWDEQKRRLESDNVSLLPDWVRLENGL